MYVPKSERQSVVYVTTEELGHHDSLSRRADTPNLLESDVIRRYEVPQNT